MGEGEPNIHVLDAAYKPFPTFSEWLAKTKIDTIRWDRYNSSLAARGNLSPGTLERAREIAKRAAAIDTGAIEGLYDVDRGFTYTVAFETSTWEAALSAKGELVRPLFEAQLRAYDYVLDLATRSEVITEAAIRTLHEVVCKAQATYRVVTPIGPQEQPLPKGQYKVLPNHVLTRKGDSHSYAPVDVTPAEMARLVAELRSEAFVSAHPVIQAAYAHYGLVVIHPFADGNGRVARALASTFTYRSISMPIVILSEHKSRYLDALEAADAGDYQVFVDFMLSRSFDTINLVNDSVRSANRPSIGEALDEIKGLYVTKGGYTQDQVDAAGKRLFNALHEELNKILPRGEAQVTASLGSGSGKLGNEPMGYRATLDGGVVLHLILQSKPPAEASLTRRITLWLPKNAAGEDDMQISSFPAFEVFTARIDEAIPAISGVLQIRVRMFAERIISEMLSELTVLAQKALSK